MNEKDSDVFMVQNGQQSRVLTLVRSDGDADLYRESGGPAYPQYRRHRGSPTDANDDSWSVIESDGSQWLLGVDRQSQSGADPSGVRRKWFLRQQRDPNGNTIHYGYVQHGSALYLRTVLYNRDNPAADVSSADTYVCGSAQNGELCIQFQWKSAPSALPAYVNGELHEPRQVLDSIRTYAGPAKQMEIQLTTRPSSVSSRLLLTEAAYYGQTGGGVSTPYSYRFDYEETPATWNTESWPVDLAPMPPFLSMTGDFDGDGRTDVASIIEGKAPWILSFSDREGWRPLPIEQRSWAPSPGLRYFVTIQQVRYDMPIPWSAVVTDLNGDGRSDIAHKYNPNKDLLRWTLYLSSGSGWIGSPPPDWTFGPAAVWSLPIPHFDRFSMTHACRTLDFNGDGRDEVTCYLHVVDAGWMSKRWTDPDQFEFRYTQNVLRADSIKTWHAWVSHCVTGDFDGDGRGELACPKDGSPNIVEFLRLNGDFEKGTFELRQWSLPDGPDAVRGGCLPMSLNGDMLTDLACTGTDGTWRLYASTGRGFELALTGAGPAMKALRQCTVGDVSGDQVGDIVCIGDNPAEISVSLVRPSGIAAPEKWSVTVDAAAPLDGYGCFLGDFAGFGSLSLMCRTPSADRTYHLVAVRQFGDTLTALRSPIGGRVSVQYQSSADARSHVQPHVHPLVKTVITDPGDGAARLRLEYSYTGGSILGDGETFSGFDAVTETSFEADPNGNWVKLSSLETQLERALLRSERAIIGRPLAAVLRNADGCAETRVAYVYRDRADTALAQAAYEASTFTRKADSTACGTLVETFVDRFAHSDAGVNIGTRRMSADFPPTNAVVWLREIEEMQPAGMRVLSERLALTDAQATPDEGKGLSATESEALVQLLGANPPEIKTVRRVLFRYEHAGTAAASRPLPVEVATHMDGRIDRRLFTWDRFGNLTTAVGPRGGEHIFAYDMNGLALERTIDPEGQTTSIQYYGTTGDGPYLAISQIVDPLGERSTFTYDSFGRLRTRSGPLGASESYEWTSPSAQSLRLKRTRGPLGETMDLDGLGRPKRWQLDYANGTVLERAIHYDALGNPKTIEGLRVAGGSITAARYQHDGLGRLIESQSPSGRRTQIIHQGDTTIVCDRDDSLLVLSFFASGKLGTARRFARKPGACAVASASALATTTYDWDILGRLRAISVDDSAPLATFTYDGSGRIARLEERNLPVLALTYDGEGSLSSVRREGVHSVSYTRDRIGRPIRVETSTGYDRQPVTTTMQYRIDPTAHLRKIAVRHGRDRHSYALDAFGRLVSRRYRPHSIFNYEHEVRLRYDALSRLTAVETPEGHVTRYLFDGPFLSEIRVGSRSIATYRDHFPSGQPLRERIGEYEVLRSVDDELRPTRWEIRHGANVVAGEQYVYDQNGQIAARLRDGKPELRFRYDPLGQLRQVRGGETVDLEWDAEGNLVRQSTLGQYGYDPQSLHPHAAVAAGPLSIAYDAAGRAVAVDAARFEYAADARPVRMSPPDGSPLRLEFDPGGAPAEARKGIWRRHYFGDRYKCGRLTCWTVVEGPFGTLAEVASRAYRTRWMITGHLGSTVATIPPHGRLELLDYDTMGKAIGDELEPLTYGFAGGRALDGERLWLFGARVYDSGIGRFLAPDPALPFGDEVRRVNRYGYGGNDPVHTVDPSGFAPSDYNIFGSLTFRWSIPQISTMPLGAGVLSMVGMGSDFPAHDVEAVVSRLASVNAARFDRFVQDEVGFIRKFGHPQSFGGFELLAAARSSGLQPSEFMPAGTSVKTNAFWMRLLARTPPGAAAAKAVFGYLVWGGNPWDYKRRAAPLSEEHIQFEIAGNYNFGYAGAAAGFPLPVLQMGAGWYNYVANRDRQAYQDAVASGQMGSWFEAPYLDDSMDAYFIMRGYLDYIRSIAIP